MGVAGRCANTPGRGPHLVRGRNVANATCSIEGCERPRGSARGWCHTHYERWRRHGGRDVAKDMRSRPTVERFVERTVQTDECWLWQGGLKENGYGRIRHDGQDMYVHRWAYEHHVGPIPDGYEVDHTCNVRHCVNPAHLQAITGEENRALIWERMNLCRNGKHPKTEGRCMGCDDEREQRWSQFVDDERYVVYVSTTRRVSVHRLREVASGWEPRCRSFVLPADASVVDVLPAGRRCANCFREPRGQRL